MKKKFTEIKHLSVRYEDNSISLTVNSSNANDVETFILWVEKYHHAILPTAFTEKSKIVCMTELDFTACRRKLKHLSLIPVITTRKQLQATLLKVATN